MVNRNDPFLRGEKLRWIRPALLIEGQQLDQPLPQAPKGGQRKITKFSLQFGDRNGSDLLKVQNALLFEAGYGNREFPPVSMKCGGMRNDDLQREFVVRGRI